MLRAALLVLACAVRAGIHAHGVCGQQAPACAPDAHLCRQQAVYEGVHLVARHQRLHDKLIRLRCSIVVRLQVELRDPVMLLQELRAAVLRAALEAGCRGLGVCMAISRQAGVRLQRHLYAADSLPAMRSRGAYCSAPRGPARHGRMPTPSAHLLKGEGLEPVHQALSLWRRQQVLWERSGVGGGRQGCGRVHRCVLGRQAFRRTLAT